MPQHAFAGDTRRGVDTNQAWPVEIPTGFVRVDGAIGRFTRPCLCSRFFSVRERGDPASPCPGLPKSVFPGRNSPMALDLGLFRGLNA